jgi:hypothetical protein
LPLSGGSDFNIEIAMGLGVEEKPEGFVDTRTREEKLRAAEKLRMNHLKYFSSAVYAT